MKPRQWQGQGEELEDNDNKGTRDANASRALGTFFSFRFYVLLMIIY